MLVCFAAKMASLKFLTISVILASMLGLVICWYAFVIEMSKELDDKYEAMCDISEHMSCSKVLTSP
jgi:vitamin-K-epoxide reductase (warfarin-sensitive)